MTALSEPVVLPICHPRLAAASDMAALTLREVSVVRGGAVVVDAVSLDVEAGSWLALIGPNGAGKSSLLAALAGIVVSRGEARVHGHELAAMSTRARAGWIALVPQRPVLPPGMSVREYVGLGIVARRPLFGRVDRGDTTLVDKLLERLELRRLARRDVTTLSGGEVQRAVIARSLAQDPEVLLLDEPTTALDLAHQQHVLDLIDDLRRAPRGERSATVAGEHAPHGPRRALTVVSALHDLTLAAQYCDLVAMLAGGRLVAEGSPSALLGSSERISEVFGARVEILHTASGPVVVPLRER